LSIVKRYVLAAAVATLVIETAACASARSRVGPPLNAPQPPPRVITPVDTPPAVATAPLPEQPARPARPAPSRPERAETPPPSTPPKPAAEPASPPTRTLTTTNATETERRARALMAAATRDLGLIDYRALGADARAQYDTARRFVDQAERALKDRNVAFAEQLADKAATLAALLQKR
jgi:hypothetical protein